MQLQAEIYNQSLQNIAAIIIGWKADAEKYQVKIAETEKTAGNVAGMEVYYQKQIDKITAIEKLAENADNYISALESQLHELKIKQAHDHTSQFNVVAGQRTRICDLPAGPVNDHLETMELLHEIIERLPQPTKTVY